MGSEIKAIIQEVRIQKPVLGNDCPKQIIEALETIHNNLFESDLTVEWVKKECYIFNKCFSSHFKKHTGHYPKEYIVSKRLIAAKKLLKETDLTVSMIAVYTGFYTLSSFCNTFKNKEKIKPSEWRELN